MDRRTDLYIRDVMVMIIRNSPIHSVCTYQSSVSRTTTSNLVPCCRVLVSNYLDKYSKMIYRCAPKIVLDSCLVPQLHQARSLYWASLPFQLISQQLSTLQQERKSLTLTVIGKQRSQVCRIKATLFPFGIQYGGKRLIQISALNIRIGNPRFTKFSWISSIAAPIIMIMTYELVSDVFISRTCSLLSSACCCRPTGICSTIWTLTCLSTCFITSLRITLSSSLL